MAKDKTPLPIADPETRGEPEPEVDFVPTPPEPVEDEVFIGEVDVEHLRRIITGEIAPDTPLPPKTGLINKLTTYFKGEVAGDDQLYSDPINEAPVSEVEEPLKYLVHTGKGAFYNNRHPAVDGTEVEITEKLFNEYMEAPLHGKQVYWDKPGELPVIAEYRPQQDPDSVAATVEYYYRTHNAFYRKETLEAIRNLVLLLTKTIKNPDGEMKAAIERLESIKPLPDKNELLDKIGEMSQDELNNFKIEDHI